MLMKTGVLVADAMTHRPVHVEPDANLVDCAKLMKEKHIGSLIVKDKTGKLIGFLTERDIIIKGVYQDRKPSELKAEDVMVENLITVKPEEDLIEAIAAMRDYEIRHVPVKKGDVLYGLLTVKDVLKVQPQLFELLLERVELKEKENKPTWKKPDGNCEVCGNYANELRKYNDQMICVKCSHDM